jgi:hypothetical protein
MLTLAQLYERHADDCTRSAETAEDPSRRALLLKLADQWRRDAQRLRQRATDGGAGSAPAQGRPSRAKPARTREPLKGAHQ